MDSETKKFLSQKILYECPKCGINRAYTLKDLGTIQTCRKCGHILEISKKLTISSEFDDEFKKDIEEYLKEIKVSFCE